MIRITIEHFSNLIGPNMKTSGKYSSNVLLLLSTAEKPHLLFTTVQVFYIYDTSIHITIIVSYEFF